MKTIFDLKYSLASLFLFLCMSILNAQDAVPDSLLSQKKDTDSVTYDFIFINQKFVSRYTFLGRDFGQRNPLSSTNLMYYFHSNFWLGASAFKFSKNDIPFQAGLSLGYYKEFSEKTDWSISYSHFFIPEQNTENSQGVFQTTFGFEWSWLYSTIQGLVLANQTPDVLINTQHSRYFEFNKKLWKKIKVSFEPKFTYAVGTNRFYNATQVAGPGGGVITPTGDINDLTMKIKPLYWETFIPIKFDLDRFSLEWGSRFLYPLSTIKDDPSKPTFVFSVDLTYVIPVRRKSK